MIRRVAKNTIALFSAQTVGYTLSFIYIVYAARYLGAEGFGVLAFAMAFTAIFGIFTDMGLNLLTVREVARDKALAPEYLTNIIATKFMLSFLTLALLAAAINLMGYPAVTVKAVYIVALSVVVGAFTMTIYSIFQAHEKIEYISVGQILSGVFLFTGGMAAKKWGAGVAGFASVLVFASLASLVYSIGVLKFKFSGLFFEWSLKKTPLDIEFCRKALKEAFPVTVALLFAATTYWTSTIMLSLMKGDAAVGWYNAVYRIVLVLQFIPYSFITAIYPIMSMFYKTSDESLRRVYEKSFKYLTIVGVPVGVAVTFLAERIIFFIYGGGYANSVLPLKILVWSTVFVFMNVTFGNLFICLDRQSIVTKITGLCVVVNVAFNIVLIPRLGIVGASITAVLTELTYLLLCFVWGGKIGHTIPKRKLVNTVLSASAGGTLMGLYMIIFHNMNFAMLVFSASLIYLFTVHMSNGIDREDIALLKETLSRSKLAQKI